MLMIQVYVILNCLNKSFIMFVIFVLLGRQNGTIYLKIMIFLHYSSVASCYYPYCSLMPQDLNGYLILSIHISLHSFP